MKKNNLTKHLLLFCSIIIQWQLAFAGNENRPIGARQTGMGSTGVTTIDLWSIHHNQAALAFLEKPVAGIFHENRFNLKELSNSAIAFALPLKNKAFGISYNRFGFELMNESKTGISYAHKLSKNFAASVQLNYLETRFGDSYYGKSSFINAEIGVLGKVNQNLSIGFHVYNVNRSKFAEYNQQRIPTNFRLGLGYKFSEKVFTTLEAEKSSYNNTFIRAGIEYMPYKNIYLRIGFEGFPIESSFGVGLRYNNFSFDFGAAYHSNLGFSPAFGLNYAF